MRVRHRVVLVATATIAISIDFVSKIWASTVLAEQSQPLDPALAGAEPFPDWRQGAHMASDLNAAMLMLIAAGRQNEAILFALKQAQGLDRTGIAQLGQMLLDMDQTFYALTVAKAAAERGIILPAIYFPIHPLVNMDLPVEPALALAIARRE